MKLKKDAADVAKAIGELGRKAIVVQTDISKPNDVDNLFSRIKADFGKLDIVVGNAAYNKFKPIMDITETEWARLISININGNIRIAEHAAKLMTAGSIILISSLGSTNYIPGYTSGTVQGIFGTIRKISCRRAGRQKYTGKYCSWGSA